MKKQLLLFLSGIIYASLDAGYQYKIGDNFDFARFILYTVVMGAYMVLINYISDRYKKKKEVHN